MQIVNCFLCQCVGIADVLNGCSRMQMDHQVLDGVQAVAILVKEGGIGVSEGVERDGLADIPASVTHFLKVIVVMLKVSPLKISPSPTGPHASMASAETG